MPPPPSAWPGMARGSCDRGRHRRADGAAGAGLVPFRAGRPPRQPAAELGAGAQQVWADRSARRHRLRRPVRRVQLHRTDHARSRRTAAGGIHWYWRHLGVGSWRATLSAPSWRTTLMPTIGGVLDLVGAGAGGLCLHRAASVAGADQVLLIGTASAGTGLADPADGCGGDAQTWPPRSITLPST